MQKLSLWATFSLIVLGLGGIWIWMSRSSAQETTGGMIPAPHPGFLMPDFSLEDLDGNEIDVSVYQGSPLVLNYWASWCGPCRAEMPALERIHAEYAKDGLVILGINGTNQDNLKSVVEFIKQYQLTFPVLLDQNGHVGRLYQIQSLPTTFFINPDGTIADLVTGGMSETLIRSKINDLLEATMEETP